MTPKAWMRHYEQLAAVAKAHNVSYEDLAALARNWCGKKLQNLDARQMRQLEMFICNGAQCFDVKHNAKSEAK